MSFPYSYSVLGLVPGLIVTVVVAFSVLYTSLIVWWVSQTSRERTKTYTILGNSVSVILSFATFVMWAKCSTLAGDGSGISQQSYSSLTILLFKYALAKM